MLSRTGGSLPSRRRRVRRLVFVFGLLNAVLFATLLPLWDGFDEAFHYGYVETLWQTGRLPVLGITVLPDDVFRSLRLTPISYIAHRGLRRATTFDTWILLPLNEREKRRRELDLLLPTSRASSQLNYEAHQPPLAYLYLAPFDFAGRSLPIRQRVLMARLLAALLSVVLLQRGATILGRVLGVPEPFADAAIFTILCSEMLYAIVAHVANDWLAVGLSALWFAAVANFVKRPGRRTAFAAALFVSAGLLTKAYFLVFALVTFATFVEQIWRGPVRLRTLVGPVTLIVTAAGPWYGRNVIVYGNLSGTQEEFGGIGIRETLAAVPRISWPATIDYLARRRCSTTRW